MKVTIDIADDLLRRARAAAAARGISLSEFVSEALAEKLRKEPPEAGRTTKTKG